MPQVSSAQAVQINIDSLEQVLLDSVNHQLQQNYIETLEKTNAQLTGYWNFPMWLITALGVLFAVGAIVSGYMIFSQSKEFRERERALFEKSEKQIEEALIAVNNNWKSMQNTINLEHKQLIQTKQLEYHNLQELAQKAKADERNELLTKMNELNQDIIGIYRRINNSEISSAGKMLTTEERKKLLYSFNFQCERCNYMYHPANENELFHPVCPKCGHGPG